MWHQRVQRALLIESSDLVFLNIVATLAVASLCYLYLLTYCFQNLINSNVKDTKKYHDISSFLLLNNYFLIFSMAFFCGKHIILNKSQFYL